MEINLIKILKNIKHMRSFENIIKKKITNMKKIQKHYRFTNNVYL
jgi:hypothetical protein